MFKKSEPSDLTAAVADIFSDMKGFTSDQDEYSKMTDQLVKLYPMLTADKAMKYRVSPDTLAAVAGNILGVVLILHYEQLSVLTSKAIMFVRMR